MTYEQLLQKNGNHVFVYLSPFDKWVKMKVNVMISIVVDKQFQPHDGNKVVSLESEKFLIDIDNPDDLASYQIKDKL